MNTGNKLKKSSVKKVKKLSPNTEKALLSKKSAPKNSLPVTLLKSPKPRSIVAPLNTEQLKAAAKPKQTLSKQPVPKVDAPKPVAPKSPKSKPAPQLKAAPKQPNVIKRHTRKTNLKEILNALSRNTNSANNFEDAYKIEGVDISREEYKKRKA